MWRLGSAKPAEAEKNELLFQRGINFDRLPASRPARGSS